MARVGWDSAIAREQVVEKLRVDLLTAGLPFEEIELPAGGSPDRVAHGLLERLERMRSGAVSITGVEWAYPEGGDLNDTLGALSFLRGPLNAVPLRQIWWMPEHITERFVVAVPDFESWFRLRLHLSEVPAFESGQLELDSTQGAMSTAEASHLADQLVERIRTAESRGIAPNRVWAELGRPLMKVLEQGGLDKTQWLARIAGFRSQLEAQVRDLVSVSADDPETLSAIARLADLSDAQNDLPRARELREQVLESRRRVLGDDAPDTVRAMCDLARTLSNEGNLIDAERLVRSAVEESERLTGRDGLLTLRSKTDLANLLVRTRRFGEARQLYEEVAEITRRLYGEKSVQALGVTANLAGTLTQQGDLSGARQLLASVLQIQSNKLGPSHPDTLITADQLACVLFDEGDFVAARELEERVLGTTHRLLGPRHPQTAARAGNLLLILVKQGALIDARDLVHRDLEWILARDPASLSLRESGIRRNVEHILTELNRL